MEPPVITVTDLKDPRKTDRRILSIKRQAGDKASGERSSKRRPPVISSTQLDKPDDNSALLSGVSLMKLKRLEVGVELLKLPRFGAKLNAAPSDLDRLSRRLQKIYDCKREAFKWPRYREIVLFGGTDGSTKKNCDGLVGRLNVHDLTVEVAHFRGTFGSYFGKRMTRDGEQITVLSPFESYFLMDTGTLEVKMSDSCVLAVEDVRALMEAGVVNFSRRYAIFSEIHRATQLYAKAYGAVRKAKDDTRNSSAETSDNRSAAVDIDDSRSSTLIPGDLNQTDKEVLPCLSTVKKSGRNWKSVEEARVILGLPVTPVAGSDLLSHPVATAVPYEIPPFSFTGIDYPARSNIVRSEQRPESLDVAFTCYSKVSTIGVTTPQFDVALVDFRRRDIPITDLFTALTNRVDPVLPMYVAKEDLGQLSGFAAVLADVPVVCYQGLDDT
ncbi:hypothetical protein BV898_09380 [Hypsibius exemplaris]|uniref:Uncharacterized protein n=1 Tax=Hypsibius exemplaris TaxID=2072580 RepID=A0A1W0WN44_HYPEX|nr:hypothetical protein BV898_09380 [Hypsibius exemplaris]